MTGQGGPPPRTPLFPALRSSWFRFVLPFQLGNALGIWAHVVAGQWVLVERGSAALVVALVPTAMSLPFVLLALPVGSIVSHRRREVLLAAAMATSGVASGLVALLTAAGRAGPVTLLLATLVIGTALVVVGVAWQSMLPETVPRADLSSATVLDGATFNAARALGPVLAGVGLVVVGSAWVFAVNAVLFGVAAGAMLVSRARWPSRVGTREPLVRSMRSGLWFVRHSPWTRRLLWRMWLFGVPSACLWALLPVVAHDRLGLTSAGLGIATGVLGLGAVLGTVVIGRLRSQVGVNVFVAAGSAVYALALVVLALSPSAPLVIAAMLPAGMAWVGVQSTWMMLANQAIPTWVRPRVIAVMLLVFQGSQAAGAAAWGLLADLVGAPLAVLGAASLMASTVNGFRRRGLSAADDMAPDLAPAGESRAPRGITGPVLVEQSYLVAPERREAFLAAVGALRLSRLRLGASAWVLVVDPSTPGLFVERYRVADAADLSLHERERLTVPEQRVREEVAALAEHRSEPTLLQVVDVARDGRSRVRPRSGPELN